MYENMRLQYSNMEVVKQKYKVDRGTVVYGRQEVVTQFNMVGRRWQNSNIFWV